MAVTFKLLTSSHLLVVVICIAFSSPSCAGVDEEQQLVVETSTAKFRGKRIEVNPHQLPEFQGSVAAYTSIPYAEPPVGELRFKRPVPKVIEGDFDATRAPKACMQMVYPGFNISLEISEDCLTLDVFVPEPRPTSAAVMVWIHGGGFEIGAGSIPLGLPIPLSVMNDVIAVTLNYRLGFLGFLASGDDEIPANLGLLDQRQALVWVQENIAGFGGDPTRVTIFGESAGSASVNFHVLSPMSAGLFSGAIMESGAMSPWAFTPSEKVSACTERTFTLAEAMNCSAHTTKEVVTCLKKKPAEDFINVLTENPALVLAVMVHPVVDGQFLPRDPIEMAAEGDFNRVNIMTGILADEGTLFVGMGANEKPTWNKTTMQDALAMSMRFNKDGVDQLVLDTVIFVYSSEEDLTHENTNFFDACAQFVGENYFVCPVLEMTELLSAGESPVYHYVMTHTPSTSLWGENTTWMGATHGEDVAYVFGSALMITSEDAGESHLAGTFNDEEVNMSLQVMKYWSNFAKTGNPNLSTKEEPQAGDGSYPAWPRFTKEERNYKELSLTFENRVVHPYPKRCHFQLEILPKLYANAAEMTRLKSMLEDKVNADSEKSCEDPDSCPGE